MQSIIIAGNRKLRDWERLAARGAIYKALKEKATLFTGCAEGVDHLAALMALKAGLKVHVFSVGGRCVGYSSQFYYHRLLKLINQGAKVHFIPAGSLKAPYRARLAIRRKLMIETAAKEGAEFLAIAHTWEGGTKKAIEEAHKAGLKIHAKSLSEEIPCALANGHWEYDPESKVYNWVNSTFL